MKKILLLIIMLLFPFEVFATNYNTPVSSNVTQDECLSFQDSNIRTSGSGYYGLCKQAKCLTNTKIWQLNDLKSSNIVTCLNGNSNFYTQTISNGCKNYTGSCSPNTYTKYCTMVVHFDCNKTKNGSIYNPPTSATVKSSTTTKKPSTTTKNTSTTTKKPSTTKYIPKTTTKVVVIPSTLPVLDENNYLSSVTISGVNFNFNRNILDYNIEVSRILSYISVNAVAESSKSIVNIKNDGQFNNNEPIIIDVLAENGSVRTYTFNIIYTKSSTSLSDNNLLKSLEIKGYPIDFKKDVNTYSIKLNKNTKKLVINYELDDDKAYAVISGNENLKNNSKVNIIITAENGNENIYTINIIKSSKLLLYIFIIIIIGLVIFGVYYLIKKFLPLIPNKEDKDYGYE